jgi:hypothetical protein
MPAGEERHYVIWCEELDAARWRTEEMESKLCHYTNPRDLVELVREVVETPERCENFTYSGRGGDGSNAPLPGSSDGPAYKQGVIEHRRQQCLPTRGQDSVRQLIGDNHYPTTMTREQWLSYVTASWIGADGLAHVYLERTDERGVQMSEYAFDPERDYMPVWRWAIGPSVNLVQHFSGHRQVSGVWIADRLDFKSKPFWSKTDEWMTGGIRLESIRINEPDLCDPSLYYLEYPAGTRVYDNRNNLQYDVHGPIKLTDEAISRAMELNPGRRLLHVGVEGEPLRAAQEQADREAAALQEKMQARRAERERQAATQPAASASPMPQTGNTVLWFIAIISAAAAVVAWIVSRKLATRA